MRLRLGYCAIALITCCIVIAASPTVITAKSPDWIRRSNLSAELLEQAIAAADCKPQLTVPYALSKIDPGFESCRQKSMLSALQTLEQKLTLAQNPELRFDLEIMLQTGRQSLRQDQLQQKYRLPYVNLSKAILNSLKNTADEIESPSERQQEILTQLKQYAGLEPNTTALTITVQEAISAQLQQPELIFPPAKQLKESLNHNAAQVSEILTFLKEQEVPNYEDAYTALKTQLFDYETFVRREVLAQGSTQFRLPRELYTLRLEQQGIKIAPEELIEQAHLVFTQVQQQMEQMAQNIAQQKGLEISNYRDLIPILKQEQLSASETLRLYQQRAQELEAILEREDLVTLPQDKFNIRLATASEKRNFPVPLYEADSRTFVIPVFQEPKKAQAYNDFTNPAMSWTLTVHELRPGHDLQHAVIKNKKLSRARTDFAANATSVEGWATYAEAVMRPYLPIEGQFMSLQFQLLRAARAFLEPELQLGKITTPEALRVLTVDAGFSRFFAEQEIERYISRFPGQAPAYFYGSQQLWQLRSQAQAILGQEFSLKKFHDFVLSPGFLTPKLLEEKIN